MTVKPLPIIISVPHAGFEIPGQVKDLNLLTENQIRLDGDEGAAEIYDFRNSVQHYLKSDIARAFVDLNRHPDDFSTDGVVKTHTCHMEPVYTKPLNQELIKTLLKNYYYPYHDTLYRLSGSGVLFGVDCHTMAEISPKVRHDHGTKRPWVCLSNADNTCPDPWLTLLAQLFEHHFGPGTVGINLPFKGGYITRRYGSSCHWFQLEISREAFTDNTEKKAVVYDVLCRFTETVQSA